MYLHCLFHQIMISYVFLPDGKKFCAQEEEDNVIWPNTPARDTVINRTCTGDRVGYKSRTCEGIVWQKVYSYCINQKLNKVSNAAEVSVLFQLMGLELQGSIRLFCQK